MLLTATLGALASDRVYFDTEELDGEYVTLHLLGLLPEGSAVVSRASAYSHSQRAGNSSACLSPQMLSKACFSTCWRCSPLLESQMIEKALRLVDYASL